MYDPIVLVASKKLSEISAMPKVPNKRRPTSVTISNLLLKRPAGESFFRRAGDQIFCSACLSMLAPRKSILDSHLKTKIHIESSSRHLKQRQLQESMEEMSTVGMQLVEAFLAANIPLNKLNNPYMKEFLNKYLPCSVASITTMRNVYIDRLYQKLFEARKERIRGNIIMILINYLSLKV